MKHFGALAVAFFGLVAAQPMTDRQPVVGPADEMTRLRSAAAVPRDDLGYYPSGESAIDALQRWWTDSSAWAAARADRLGDAGAQRLSADIRRISPNLNMRVISLGGGAYLVSNTNHIVGSAFIMAPRNDHMEIAWRLSDPPQGRDAVHARALHNWTPAGTVTCTRDDVSCGPMSIDQIGLLPPDRRGRIRFYTLGTHLSLMGATKGGQLVAWQWDGRTVTPLMISDFLFMVFQHAPVLTVHGANFFLTIKDDPEHYFGCGSCEGRQVHWRFRAEPEGIRDLGRTSLAPELDLIDAVTDRLVRHRSYSDLSDAGPATFLGRQVRESLQYEPPGSPDKDPTFYAMMGFWRLTHSGSERQLCFSADGIGGIFTIAEQAGRLRLVAAHDVPENSCEGPGAHL